MTDINVDVAVIGAGVTAAFLAGLLAERHGLKVVLVGERSASARLPRGFEVSVSPVTRPETWTLIEAGAVETERLLRRLGAGKALFRAPVLFSAENEPGLSALWHVRHLAAGFGREVRRHGRFGHGGQGLSFSLGDALGVHPDVAMRAMDPWLERIGVIRAWQDGGAMRLHKGGLMRLSQDGSEIEARQVVLADEDAITRFAAPSDLGAYFRFRAFTHVVTERAPVLGAPFVFDAGRSLAAHQHKSGIIMFSCEGDAFRAREAIAAGAAGSAEPLRISGEVTARQISSPDDAPVIGVLPKSGAFAVAGLGASGLFALPALARFVAGAASDSEAAYFTARAPAPAKRRRTVAEFAPHPQPEAVA